MLWYMRAHFITMALFLALRHLCFRFTPACISTVALLCLDSRYLANTFLNYTLDTGYPASSISSGSTFWTRMGIFPNGSSKPFSFLRDKESLIFFFTWASKHCRSFCAILTTARPSCLMIFAFRRSSGAGLLDNISLGFQLSPQLLKGLLSMIYCQFTFLHVLLSLLHQRPGYITKLLCAANSHGFTMKKPVVATGSYGRILPGRIRGLFTLGSLWCIFGASSRFMYLLVYSVIPISTYHLYI